MTKGSWLMDKSNQLYQLVHNLRTSKPYVRSLSYTDSGRAQGWGTALECTTKPCGQIPAHSMCWQKPRVHKTRTDFTTAWINTTVILDKASMAYKNTHRGMGGAKGSMTTNDNGKTWKGDQFNIPAHFFPTD
jgi:hypothetical protein